MKIIVAGECKTGTKSLTVALTTLGYNVYDCMEHYWYHCKYWKKIYEGNGSIEDFKKMYKNVDAVVDAPAFFFWEEIHWAFPDAKIILAERDEDSWYKSRCKQAAEFSQKNGVLEFLKLSLLPTARDYRRHALLYGTTSNGIVYHNLYGSCSTSEMVIRQRYRKHNAYVKMKAPKNQLLVFNVKEGWEPLCKFLGKEVPITPFPHKNLGGKDVIPMMDRHPVGKQIRKEYFVLKAILVVFAAIAIFIFFAA